MLVLEDCDSINGTQHRKSHGVDKDDGGDNNDDTYGNSRKTEFLSLLSGLEQIQSDEDALKVVVLTTNHKDLIDPAILRAGRIDMEFHIDKLNRDDVIQFFKKEYPGGIVYDLLDDIQPVEIGVLQQIYLDNVDDPVNFITTLNNTYGSGKKHAMFNRSKY